MSLTTSVIDGVARATLQRPEARNALNSELVEALRGWMRRSDADSAIRALVLDGAPPGFCAGSDLRELGRMSVDEMANHERITAALSRGIASLSKPVVAAVEGFAIGGGLVLAASCDVVVTGYSVRWHLPEVSIGWIPPWGLEALRTRMDTASARLLVWGVKPVTGVEAHRLGLADYLADDGDVCDTAIAAAQQLAELPATAVASTKRAFAAGVLAHAESLDEEANRLFIHDAHGPAGQATLARFREMK